MPVPEKIFKMYLVDQSGNSYYIDSDGDVQKQSLPREIKYLPEGWQDEGIEWVRNKTYLGLDISYTPEYKFVKDGAKICRHVYYELRGPEGQLYLNVAKRNAANGIYEIYLTGEFDFTQVNDNPLSGFTVSIIQGGAAKYIKSKEDVNYSIPCNETIPEAINVLLDGINQPSIMNYEVLPLSYQYNQFTMPIAYLNADSKPINCAQKSQEIEEIAGTAADYIAFSQNWFYKAYRTITGVIVRGEITFGNLDATVTFTVDLYTSSGARYTLFTGLVGGGATQNFTFSETINLVGNEAAFIIISQTGFEAIAIAQTKIYVESASRNDASEAYALQPLVLFKKIVAKLTGGKFGAESSILETNKNLCITGGDQLRGLTTGELKTSLSAFFKTYSILTGGALGVRFSDQTILFEPREYFLDNNVQLLDLGEVSEFMVSTYNDFLWSQIKVGWPDQSNTRNQDKYEFNSEQVYSTPITRNQKTLDLVCEYRGDPFGIETFRQDLGNETVSTNKNSNEIFVVDVEPSGPSTSSPPVVADIEILQQAPIYSMFFDNRYNDLATILQVGTNFKLTNTISNNKVFTVISNILIAPNGLFITVNQLVTSENVSNAVLSFSFYNLRRPTYVPSEGIYDNTVYNRAISPKSLLKINGGLIKGGVNQMPNEVIAFESSKKSSLMVSGTTVESGNLRISSLADSFYKPLLLKFQTKVHFSIINLLQSGGIGYITGTTNGRRFYGFPEKVSIKPSFRDSQEWELLCSSLTDVPALAKINENSIQVSDMGIISNKNSMRFVPLDRPMSAKYHHIYMDHDWWKNRIKGYTVGNDYAQKRQTNDTESVQVITKGASVSMILIDCHGTTIDPEITFTQISNASIVNPYQLWQANLNWSIYPVGTYWLVMTVGIGANEEKYISEPIETAVDFPNTLLFEYTNTENTTDMVFNPSVYSGKLRVEGVILNFKPGMKRTDYENLPLDIVTLYGLGYRGWNLFIGSDFGIPDYIWEKINLIMTLDNVTIDGIQYTLDKDAKWEEIQTEGSAYAFASIPIRDSFNKQGISINGQGMEPGALLIQYPLNTRLFTNNTSPNANQQDNIIQIIESE